MRKRLAATITVLCLSGAGLAAAQTPPPPAAPPAPAVQKLPIYEAAGIMGRSVRGPDGQDVGRIVDVIVDQTGEPRAAVIDFGGFLGLGNRRIAVDWSTLRFAPGNDAVPVKIDLTPDQLKAAPEYKESLGTPPAVVTPPSAAAPQGEKAGPDKPPPEKPAPEPGDGGKATAPVPPTPSPPAEPAKP